jgi:hypothetical protein
MQRRNQAAWEQLRKEPWLPDVNHAPCAGRIRLQIIEMPSSGQESFWEVCDQDDRWNLPSARVVEGWYPGPVRVQGYEPVTFPSDVLKLFWKQITSLRLPLEPDLSHFVGLDGTLTRLTVIGNRWEWWSTSPPQWAELTKLTGRMIEAFKIAALAAGNSK